MYVNILGASYTKYDSALYTMDMKSFRCIKATAVLTMFPKSKRRHSKDAKHLNVASPNPNSCKNIKMDNVSIRIYSFDSAHVL